MVGGFIKYFKYFIGILGTLTSLLMVYLGVQAGRTLNTYQNVRAKVFRWITWGFITVSIILLILINHISKFIQFKYIYLGLSVVHLPINLLCR